VEDYHPFCGYLKPEIFGVASLSIMSINQFNTSQKLREIRKSKGWSLQDVEKHSKGKWKAVVIGSYERTDRAISLNKTIELMNFYQVPITALFEEKSIPAADTGLFEPLILDQRLINSSSESNLIGVKRLLSFITARRRDWNGEVLSLRSTDLQFIAILLDKKLEDASSYLKEGGYLLS
jgi:transcriptional regulator with XRE-family HTH domain